MNQIKERSQVLNYILDASIKWAGLSDVTYLCEPIVRLEMRQLFVYVCGHAHISRAALCATL